MQTNSLILRDAEHLVLQTTDGLSLPLLTAALTLIKGSPQHITVMATQGRVNEATLPSL